MLSGLHATRQISAPKAYSATQSATTTAPMRAAIHHRRDPMVIRESIPAAARNATRGGGAR